MKDDLTTDTFDLVQFLETVWEGKWKIILTTLLSMLAVMGMQMVSPPPNFTAVTEFRPILAGDAEKYRKFNGIEFLVFFKDQDTKDQADLIRLEKVRERDLYEARERDLYDKTIYSAVLDQLFIEQLGNRALLADLFEKNKLLNRDDFDDDKDFRRALSKLAAGVSILPPVNEDGSQRGASRQNWTLRFEYNNERLWIKTISELKTIANQNVKNVLRQRFASILAAEKQKRKFMVEDLDMQISDLIFAYEQELSNKVAFLSEQAAIARTLGIKTQEKFPQTSVFTQLNTAKMPKDKFVSNQSDNLPVYFRGYEALEKEIMLLKTRDNNRAFIDGLLELERKKRVIEQDKSLERAEKLFIETPVAKDENFTAASFSVEATEFEYRSQRMLTLALAGIASGLISAFFVVFASAVRRRQAN